MPTPKILVVEDEVDLRELLVHHLKREGFFVLATGDGHQGLQLVQAEQPEVILLDVMLEGLDGLSVCRQVKASPALHGSAVMMISARDQEADVLRGLDQGADDYVRKPFNVKEVIARVRTLLRRAPAPRPGKAAEDELCFPPLVLNHARHEVLLADAPLAVTATEYRLLHLLMSSPERVFNRNQLLAHLSDHKTSLSGRNIDVHIRSLRRKLGPHARLIDTARGVGYRFTPGASGTG